MNIKSIVHKHLLNEVRVKSSDRIKLYEDTEWVVIIPLTHKASCKYGHGSKWCTSVPETDEKFLQHTSGGVLVYYINKKTDDKYAEDISIYGKQEFFNKQNQKITNLPDFLLSIQKEVEPKIFNLLKEKSNLYKSNKIYTYLDNLLKGSTSDELDDNVMLVTNVEPFLKMYPDGEIYISDDLFYDLVDLEPNLNRVKTFDIISLWVKSNFTGTSGEVGEFVGYVPNLL